MKKYIVLCLFLIVVVFLSSEDISLSATMEFRPFTNIEQEMSFFDYMEKNEKEKFAKDEIIIEGNNYQDTTDKNIKSKTESVVTSESGATTWNFDVVESGMYNIKLNYFPTPGKGKTITRQILVNGDVLYDEFNVVNFNRQWVDDGEIKTDKGNELEPMQVEKPAWTDFVIESSKRQYSQPLSIYLDKGVNSITLNSISEPMEIKNITLSNFNSEYKSKDYPEYDGEIIKVEGQDADVKSGSDLGAKINYGEANVSPSNPKNSVVNHIGGNNWDKSGKYIEWNVDAPKNGKYYVAFHAMQNVDRDLYSVRRLEVNGEIQDVSHTELRFDFSSGFKLYNKFNDEPISIDLNKGDNKIKLEIVQGSLGIILNQLEDSNESLNNVYRDITMITTTTPDIYRDYRLEVTIPDLMENLEIINNNLNVIVEQLQEITGKSGSSTVVIEKIIRQLEEFIKDPKEITKQLNNFKGNISALPGMIGEIEKQALSIDYFILGSKDDVEKYDSKIGFFEKIIFEAKRFIYSFKKPSAEDDSIEVWVARGQDEYQALNTIITNFFTPETGIEVDLKLVSPNALLPATLSGKGPDIGMFLAQDLPVNYATRNALQDLGEFDDYDKIESAFVDSSLTPFEFEGGNYALPVEHKFPVMFYRTDIFEELNLTVPKTWEELTSLLPLLSAQNMEMMLEPTVATNSGILLPNLVFSTILDQYGGEYYIKEDRESGLTTPEALEAFEFYNEFYTNYGVDVQADLSYRFKTGEVPIAIMDYTQYNQISVFAPELAGNWAIAPVPGTKQKDGTLDSTAASNSAGMVMFENTENKDAAWEFMKWVTSTEAQEMYGTEVESLIGIAGRFQSANIEALKNSSYPNKDLDILVEQQADTFGVEQVPGGYLTGRQVDYAFRNVVNDGANPKEAMYLYTQPINIEISRKRKEFLLEYIDWSLDEVEVQE